MFLMGKKDNSLEPAPGDFGPFLIQAKLEVPALPHRLVSRTAVIQAIKERDGGRCTALLAPAGFGKTVAAVQWLQQNDIAAAWFTLDPADNSLSRFWSYLVGALAPFIFAEGCLHSKSDFYPFMHVDSVAALEKLLPLLIQQLYCSKAHTVLILDDYHHITDFKIHETLYYFIRYAPRSIHIVLLSRTQPPFLLTKSKLRMEYNEIKADKLCFSQDEIATYCGLVGLELSPAQQQVLFSRTEGWPVGISIAAEYMEKGGFAAFEERFRGDNREIGAYLEEEIFNIWPRDEQEFLLQTAVLESLNGDLCHALRESNGSSASILNNLAEFNPFITPFNPEKGWYRCAPLLREYLLARLVREREDLRPHLHRRAATWYWQQNLISEALHHLYEGGSHALVVRLLEQQAPRLLSAARTMGDLLKWLDKLPTHHVEGSPMLCLAGAWAQALTGRIHEAQQWMEKAAALAEDEDPLQQQENDLTQDSHGKIHLNPAEALHREKETFPADLAGAPQGHSHIPLMPHQLQQELSLLRVYLLARQKNIPAAMELLDHSCRNLKCDSIFRERGLSLHRDEPGVLAGPLGLYGRLQQLSSISQSMQEEMDRIGFPSRYFNLVRAELLYEWNNLEAALPAIMQGLEAAERDRSLDTQVPLFFVLAKISRAQGDLDQARDVIAEAERRVHAANEHQWQPLLTALSVRLSLRQGEAEPARQWLQDHARHIYEKPTAPREYIQLTLARVLIAERKYHEAILLLTRQLVFAQGEDRLPSIIEILNLQAFAFQELGHTGKAMACLARSLCLASPEGYVRTFIDEGSPMWILLQKYAREAAREAQDKQDQILPYVRSLLRHMKRDSSSRNLILPRQKQLTLGSETLLDPLTKRELQVLRLLAQELSNADIAAALSITLNTVKVFNRNIFAKLDVKNRTSAIERARALGIVE